MRWRLRIVRAACLLALLVCAPIAAEEPGDAATEADVQEPNAVVEVVVGGAEDFTSAAFRAPATLDWISGDDASAVDVQSEAALAALVAGRDPSFGFLDSQLGSAFSFPGSVARTNGLDFGLLSYASTAMFYDLSEIEVLRGPLARLPNVGFSGRTDVRWREPHEWPEVFGEVGLSQDGFRQLRGAANLPLSGAGDDRLNARAVLEHTEFDGESHYSARLSTRSRWGDGDTLVLRAFGEEGGSPPFGTFASAIDRDFYGAEGALDVGLVDRGNVSLEVAGGWRKLATRSAFGGSAWSAGNAEARLASQSDGPVDFALDFFLFRERGPRNFESEITEGGLTLDVEALRLLGNDEIDLSVFGSLRYGQNRAQFSDFLSVPPILLEFERRPLWSEIGVRYRPSLDHLVYAKYSHVRDADAAARWEIGWHSIWLDQRAELFTSMFRGSKDRSGPVATCPSPGSPPLPCPFPLIDIFPFDPTVFGIDTELDLRLIDAWRVSAGLSYLLGKSTVHSSGRDFSRRFGGARRWSATLLTHYDISLGTLGALRPLLLVAWLDTDHLGTPHKLQIDARLRWTSPDERFWIEGYAADLAEDGFDRFTLGEVERRFGVRIGFAWDREGAQR